MTTTYSLTATQLHPSNRCLECGGPLYAPGEKRPRGPVRTFCTPSCGDAFHERRRQRGAELYDLVMGRGYEPDTTSQGEYYAAMRKLKRAWRTEDRDRDRRGNRKSWGDWRSARSLIRKPKTV